MDVRCEQCGSEYELEDHRVTEAGVAVKCVDCGHLFKVRKRAATARPTQPPAAEPRADAPWMVRSADGKVQEFSHLTTLQQWIVERRVDRQSELSRGGGTWRKLGEIAELGAFFRVVDEADAAAAAARQPQARARSQADPPGVVAVSAPAEPTLAHPDTTIKVEGAVPAHEPRLPARSTASPPAAGQSFSGPTGGLKGAPTVEPSWTGDRQKRPSLGGVASEAGPRRSGAGPQQRFDAIDAGDDEPVARPGSKLPLVLLISALLIGGGGFVLWKFVLAPRTPLAGTAPLAPADGGPPLGHPLDAGLGQPPDVHDVPALAGLPAALDDGSDAALTQAAQALGAARSSVAAQDAEVLAGLARIEAAWADAFASEAALAADARGADQARAEAKRHAQRAETFAAEASVKAPDAVPVILARADARRVNGAKPAEIDKLVAPLGKHAEATYARAMSRVAAGKPADARKLFEGMLGGGVAEPRARWQLALMAFQEHRSGDAQTHLDALLTLAPDNARYRALSTRLAEAPAIPDAGPPPAAPDAGPVASSKPPGPGTSPPPEHIPQDYDAILKKANDKAERGDCAGAIPLYDRALDVRPGGVEALTGMGYCLMDRKEFGRAQASFRAALGISPRYGDAIMGLAEASRSLGENDRAIEQYKKYLDLYPGGPRAKLAQKRLDALAPPAPQPQPEPQPEPQPQPTTPSGEQPQ